MEPGNEILFEAPSPRVESFTSRTKQKLFDRLQSMTQEHLRNRRRQLVVFSFDFIAHQITLNGVFEKGELDTVFGWMSTRPEAFDGVAIDVGANIGNHSLYFSDYFSRVYSFEPNPRTYKVLRLNSELVSNVMCFNCGISDSDQTANLNIEADNIGHSNISPTAGAVTVPVRLKTLDSLIEPDEKVRLIKYDVEGHEYQAISGSRTIIERNKPIILFEQLANEIKDGTSPTIELLRSIGYSRVASVRRMPTRLLSPHRALNWIGAILNRLPFGRSVIFGATWTIQIERRLGVNDYPILVAIPD